MKAETQGLSGTVTELAGIGPARAGLLAELGIHRAGQDEAVGGHRQLRAHVGPQVRRQLVRELSRVA